MYGARYMRYLAVGLGWLAAAGLAAGAAAAPRAGSARAVTFEIDGVQLTLRTTFLPGLLVTSRPGDFLQMATASAPRPFRELTLTAVPYGARATNERLPRAERGGAAAYLAELERFRTAQGARIDAWGPAAMLFDQPVNGQASVVALDLYGEPLTPVLIVEWVAEAGDRLWLLRAARELPAGSDLSAPEMAGLLSALEGLSLDSTTLDRPSTLGRAASITPAAFEVPEGDAVTPSNGYAPWWNNYDCDKGAQPTSYRLGATYQNMPACGPLGTLWLRSYGTGGLPRAGGVGEWGVYEWQCVELSMRYLRLRHNVNVYPGNGSQVVDNYASNQANYNPNGPYFEKISNGTVPPAPQPGDVLSYGSTSTAGHTAVVKSVNVGSNGSGSITVVEQNNTAGGQSTLTVSNWFVNGNAGAVTKWLVGDQDATPAVGRDASGRLAVFARGTDNNLYYKLSDNWGGAWASLGGGGLLRGNPSVVRYGDGRLEVFSRFSDGSLRFISQTAPSGGWSGWTSLGGNIQGSPSAVLNSGGGVHVAVWNADNQLAFAWKSSAAAGWSAVTVVGGLLTANPEAILDAANCVAVVVRNITHGGHIIRQSAPGSGSWGSWTALNGTLDTGLAVGKNSDGRLEVFAVGTDGSMVHNWETCTGACNTWSGWYGLGSGQWTRTPVVARNANGALEVFAVKLTNSTAYDNAPYHISQLDGWAGWAWLDGQMRVGRPAIGAWGDGRLEMFVRGDDRVMSHKWQNSANSLSWSGWAGIGGSWP